MHLLLLMVIGNGKWNCRVFLFGDGRLLLAIYIDFFLMLVDYEVHTLRSRMVIRVWGTLMSITWALPLVLLSVQRKIFYIGIILKR
jgi:hypothetical protein